MSLFGGTSAASAPTVASGVSIQSSCYGGVVPVWYGRTRGTGNLIDYDDFQAIQQKSSSGSGKGGGGGGGGKGGSTTTDYNASFIFALGEGPMTDIQTVFASKSATAFTNSHLSFATGSLTQSPWGVWTTKHPAKALAYAGTAYVYAAAYDLGQSAQLPNLGYEATGHFPSAISGLPDADPAAVVLDVLTNPRYGVGFPSARIPLSAVAVFSGYCRATGMVISPLFNTQTDAASLLNQIVQDCNSEFVWSGTTLTIVPYGDQSITANGATYTAPSAPEYSLGDNDFLDMGNIGDPVQCSRKRPSDAWNSIKLEYLNRANQYNAEIVEAKDQAAIEAYGLRANQSSQAHQFCDRSAATMAATLKLQRQAVRNIYTFTLGWRYCLLDPMDIVEINDSGLGLVNQWVRILSLEEDDNGGIKVTAEEYLDGTGAAPLYSYAAGAPYTADYDVVPGSVNVPFIFEPNPSTLAALGIYNPVIMLGASSSNPNWGGAYVHISADGGSTYKLMGEIEAPARQGFVVGTFISGSDPDTTHTLNVDLTESMGSLLSGTIGDADNGLTLCYVDGELISFSTATLTAANKYALSGYIRRGVYSTPIGAHLNGAEFCRLNDAVISIPLPPGYTGVPLKVKFQSYNIFEANPEDISTLTIYSYTPAGFGVFVAPPTGVGTAMGTLTQPDGTVISYMNIFWSASIDPVFDSYLVEWSIHGSGAWKSATVGSNTLLHPVMPVQPGDVYDVRVLAIRTKGGPFFSAYANGSIATVVGKIAAPAAASALIVTPGYRSNSLKWAPSTNSDVIGYVINRGTTNVFGASSEVQFAYTLSWDDTNLTAGTTYYYWLAAQNTSDVPSAFIGPVSGVPNLIDTPNVKDNAITAKGNSVSTATDDWINVASGGAAAKTYIGPTLTTSGFYTQCEFSLVIGNADNPAGMPAGGVNGYPFYAPARIIFDVYRIDVGGGGGGTVHVSGVTPTVDGGEFTDSSGNILTSGTARLSCFDGPPAGTWQYQLVVTPFGTLTCVPTAAPFSNIFIQIVELKK